MSYYDKELTCRDCGAGFTFTAGQQEFFASKGLDNEPSRCKECQSAKKAKGGKGGNGCFKCGASDHWSRECPIGGGGGGGNWGQS